MASKRLKVTHKDERAFEQSMLDSAAGIQTVPLANGQPVDIHLDHPEFMVMVDGVGNDTNQKDNGHVGGKRFVLPVGLLDHC
jgi:hypothetical protein